jgi:teichuronic acid biosynthesis glycosyltransferase TuaG
MALVSVVMPCYNTEPYVQAAIRSVLDQTHADLELLVVDDASTDGTADIVAALADVDERVVLLRRAENGGAARARNTALERARGDYVAFLDSDDLWLPRKLERQLGFAAVVGAPLTYTSYYAIDAHTTLADAATQAHEHVIDPPGVLDYRTMLEANYIGSPTAMYDRRKLGTRLMPDLRKRQDYALWLAILREGHTARGLLEPLSAYRRRHGSLSQDKLELAGWNWRLYRQVEGLSIPQSLLSLGQTTVRSLAKSRR